MSAVASEQMAVNIKTATKISDHFTKTEDFSSQAAIREGQFCLFFQKKWSFALKNWGSFVLQHARKVGHLRVAMLQFLRRDQRRLRLPRTAVDSQPCDLPMTNFSCLLQHKGAPTSQLKQPLFWKKRQICASLMQRYVSRSWWFSP